jgi:hypothetical protein
MLAERPSAYYFVDLLTPELWLEFFLLDLPQNYQNNYVLYLHDLARVYASHP